MNTGDIIFIHGTSLTDVLIEEFDRGKFNHVCMAMPNGYIVETQYPINTRCVPNPYNPNEITTLDLGLTDEERMELVKTHFKYLPYKYDLKQIFGILLHDVFGWDTNRTWNNKNKLICSELVVDLLNEIDYFKKRGYFFETRNLTPNELYSVLIKLKVKDTILKGE